MYSLPDDSVDEINQN